MSTPSPLQATLDAWFRRNAATRTAWCVVGFVALYGVLAAAQLLIWIAAVLSIALVLITKGEWARVPGGRMYWLLLGCLLLPGLISSFDALNLDKALSTSGRLLAYGLIGWFFLRLAPTEDQWGRTALWLTGLLVVWSLDGIVQEWRGISLSGYPLFTGLPEGHKVTGSMGLDYGPNLAVLSPLLFEALRLHGRRWPALWLALPLLAVAISLSASRYSAGLFLVSALLCGLLWVRGRSSQSYWTPLLVMSLSLCGLLLPLALVPHLAERLALLGTSASASPEELNIALAYRPELWQASWQLFVEHWVNGVGVRGSAGAVNPILAASPIFPEVMLSRGWHPHLGVLEIAADTGVIGLAGYAVFIGALITMMLRANQQSRGAATALLTIVFLAMFPLSSALSMYSFTTGSLTWPLLALAVGSYIGSPASRVTADEAPSP